MFGNELGGTRRCAAVHIFELPDDYCMFVRIKTTSPKFFVGICEGERSLHLQAHKKRGSCLAFLTLFYNSD